MKKNEFKCDKCEKIYQYGWTKKEALKEMRELWGEILEKNRVLICDDCWQEIHPEKNLEWARKCGYKK
ncbi:MAG: hypothetical protein AABY22_24935 [Nanoarchaeota archaeon]